MRILREGIYPSRAAGLKSCPSQVRSAGTAAAGPANRLGPDEGPRQTAGVSTPPARPPLSSFWTDLPRAGKWFLSTIVIDFIGNGLVLPFNVVYLHEVRGFDLARVGLLLAIPAVVGMLVLGPAGIVIDRIGARVVVIASLVVQMAAYVVLASATTESRAVVALLMLGVSGGVSWPAINALIATIIPSGIRQRYFGLSFTLLNLGIGIGGIVGGLFVDVARPGTFVAIYLVDAATFLAPLAILLGPLRHHSGRAKGPGPTTDQPAADATGAAGSTYRTLLRDRSLRPVLVLTFVASFVGYGQLNTGLPAFGRAQAQISTQILGWAFAVNTVVIVVLQLVVLQRIEGRRRTRMLIVMSVVWAIAFLALGLSGLVPASAAGSLLFMACLGVFGLGETLYQPTVPAMVNDLAPDHLRGRYNALMSICWQSAAVVGPPVAGFLVGRGWGGAYIGMLVAGCGLVALLSLATERRIPDSVNGVRVAEIARAAEPQDGDGARSR